MDGRGQVDCKYSGIRIRIESEFIGIVFRIRISIQVHTDKQIYKYKSNDHHLGRKHCVRSSFTR